MNTKEFIQTSAENPYLSFSYCSVPFVYVQNGETGMEIIYSDRKTEKVDGYHLTLSQSEMIFNRDKKIEKVVVYL